MRWSLLIIALAAGCNPDEGETDPDVDTGTGLLGTSLVDVFPSPLLMQDGAVSIPLDALPVQEDGTPLPVDRFGGWRSGFSPAQTTVFRLDGVDPNALPDWRSPTPGEGGVILADLTDGRFLPVMAELDAHPDATESPSLLVRPLELLSPGHLVAVVVTTDAVARPDRMDALLRGEPPASLEGVADVLLDAVDTLDTMGMDRETVAAVTVFPVDAGRAPLEQLLVDPPLATDVQLTRIRDANDGDTVAPLTRRVATGRFTVPSYLNDDGLLAIDGQTGVVSQTGTTTRPLYIHIPESVADAPAGTVPVVLFGHGIFSTPSAYLDQDTDANGVLAVLDEMGAIGIATTWAGLSSDDRIAAITAAQDFGRLPAVCDLLVESNVAVRSLQRLILEGDLLDDPVFQGDSGQSLARRGQLMYYGISLGGIEGAVQVASGAPFDAAVLHVGGGMWSTMLERSTQWVLFEGFLVDLNPDPADRQVLYAASQLFWDPVDPVGWMDVFPTDVPTLWQESLGDEQVPNMTTRALVRSIDAPVLSPTATEVWGVQTVTADQAPDVLMAQFDPGRPLPADVNRPPDATGAHSIPRTWVGQHIQTEAFLDPDAPGTVVHACGEAVCSSSNTGADLR